jgi:uncharacterized FlaG/YvyC family protein
VNQESFMGSFAKVPIASAAGLPESTLRLNTVPKEERVFNQAVAAAAGQLNEAGYLGAGREVKYSIEQGTHTPVIQVVDSQTKEVITQWPAAYVLQLAAEMKTRAKDPG